MTNLWMSFENLEYSFAEWQIRFPVPQSDNKIKDLIMFIEEYINISNQYNISVISAYNSSEENLPEKINPYYNFPEKVLECYKDTGDFYFLGYDKIPVNYTSESLESATMVSYYNEESEIETGFCYDLATIFRKTNRELPDFAAKIGYMESCPPISFYSGGFRKNKEYKQDFYCYLKIGLKSNIWFPFIHSVFEESKKYQLQNGWISNQELAWEHTSRFNSWLTQITLETKKRGGEFIVTELKNFGETYRSMIKKDGTINLSMDSAELPFIKNI